MGYFYKLAQCDAFVLLDHVEFTKKSFTKRVKIHKQNNMEEAQFLTVPLQKHADHTAINALKLVEDEKWQKKIHAQIYNTYHKSPFYHQIEPLLDRFFVQPMESNSFSLFTIEIIKYIADVLKLETEWHVSSALDIDFSGPDVNVEIVSFLNGQTYVSGMGAKKYQQESLFDEKGILVEYSDFPSKFKTFSFPDQYFDKSILSYLATYDVAFLRDLLHPTNF
jgi:hypothetical protein